MSVKAIDVSVHQKTIDWKKVKADGIQAAIIRAGYGRYEKQKDKTFDANMKGTTEAGILVGVYWYSYASSANEAKEEAKICLKVIAPYKDKITLPVFFDQEYEPVILGATKSVRTACCNAFLEEIRAAGYDAGLYASYDWVQNKIGAVEGKKWIAQYDTKCDYTGKDLYLWQYTNKGRVDGISGKVDMDTGYFELPDALKNGWEKSGNTWYYYENGKCVKGAWRKVKNRWYYFASDGKMVKGRATIKGKRYYFNESAYEGLPEGALWMTDAEGART